MADDETDERDLFFSGRPAPRHSNAPRSAEATHKADTPQQQLQGHRERLRERARRTGPETLADYELLELLLFRFVPRADTKSRAKALIERFGSLAEVLGAPPHLLAEVQGIGPSVAFDLKMVAAAASRMARGELRGRQVLASWSAVIDYCKTAMAFEEREQFRILFLDKKNKLIADEVQQVGTVDQTPAYPREVVRRALELSATAVVLVHNHPTWPFRSRSITPHHLETQELLGLS